MGSTLWLLLGAVGLVLLIACIKRWRVCCWRGRRVSASWRYAQRWGGAGTAGAPVPYRGAALLGLFGGALGVGLAAL